MILGISRLPRSFCPSRHKCLPLATVAIILSHSDGSARNSGKRPSERHTALSVVVDHVASDSPCYSALPQTKPMRAQKRFLPSPVAFVALLALGYAVVTPDES